MKRIKSILLILLGLAVTTGAYVALRGYRVASTAYGVHHQAKLLIESGGTIGEAPASQTFSVDYLDAIFGDNPALLGELKKVVQSGLSDAPALNLGVVSAMIVTYHQDADGEVKDVVAHVIGGFPLGKLKPGFHRDGYFRNLVEQDVWHSGNMALGLLGRDMVLFAEETVADEQRDLIEGLIEGNILPLVDRLVVPLKFTMVMPDPRHLVPRQLKRHVQAMIIKGTLSQEGGDLEVVMLTPSKRSASYAMTILHDMKRMSEIVLKTKFGGIVRQREWGGEHADHWWALELVKTSEQAILSREENIISFSSEFERVGMNVVLKTLERMGRDLAQSKMSLGEKIDPRLVDSSLESNKQRHHWNKAHRWGPNWPLAPSADEIAEYEQSIPVPVEPPPIPAPTEDPSS